jgi:hypothetical protein
MTDYIAESGVGGEGGGRGVLSYFYDKAGGGWLGYRGLFAVLLSSPQLGLFAYWITYTGVTLSSGMFYLTLIPFLISIPLIALLPAKSGLTPKKLATFAVMALIPYTLYDWARVPINLAVGVPFWDHWFDWGASILGSTGTLFTYENLTAGLAAHILRGWGFAMAYYILVRRVTLLSAFAFAWAMTVIYWVVFPIWVLTDALPPWIWWFTAWVSHIVFALGLWVAPKIFQRLYKRPSEISAVGSKGNKEISNYQRSWKTTLFAILASQGFGLMFGAAFFGYVVTSQPPSIYPVFGYGKPPPILIEGFSSYHWAIVGAVIGFIFLYLALRSRMESSLATQKQK